MKNVLDEELVGKTVNEHTKEAFGKFKIAAAVFLFIIILNLTPKSHPKDLVSFILSIVTIIFSFSALIPSANSFSHRERETFKKWISLVGSLFILAIYLSLLGMILWDEIKYAM